MTSATEQWPWIDFREIPQGNRSTHVWSVVSRRHGIELGQVRWFGRWHCYAFFPAPETVFNTVCLRGIEQFVRAATSDHRRNRRRANFALEEVAR